MFDAVDFVNFSSSYRINLASAILHPTLMELFSYVTHFQYLFLFLLKKKILAMSVNFYEILTAYNNSLVKKHLQNQIFNI